LIDLETEAKVIGCMIKNTGCLDYGLSELKKEDFADKINGRLFEIISNMYADSKTISIEAVYETAKDLIKDMSISYSRLIDVFVNQKDFQMYVQKLKCLTKARKMATMAQNILTKIENKDEISEITSYAETAIYAISTDMQEEPIVTPQEQAEEILNSVAEHMDKKTREQKCIYTSFKRLNYYTGGFEAGDLVIISGPTGGGKTAFAMNIARDIGITQKQPFLYINTEMSKDQIALRWAAILSGDWKTTNTALRMGEITDKQFTALTGELDGIYKSQLYSIRIPDLTIPKMLSTIRRFAIQKKVRAVAVDYIGRVDMSNTNNKDDWQMLLSAARKLKTIAQQYEIVVFMLAQVDSNGKLAMAKYMEHEADLHLQIRPIDEDEKAACISKMEWFWNYAISIEKGRSSPRGTIPVRFAGEKLLFISDAEVAMKHAELIGDEQESSGNTAIAVGTRKHSKRGNEQRY
jgi:replicative DNA helicase